MQTTELYLTFISFRFGEHCQSIHATTSELIKSIHDLQQEIGIEIMTHQQSTEMLERLALDDEYYINFEDGTWISVQVASDYAINQTQQFNHFKTNNYANKIKDFI